MKKITALFLIICIFLTSCGSATEENQQTANRNDNSESTEASSSISSENTYSWQVEETLLPSADAELNRLIPEGTEIGNSDWKFVDDMVYRSVFIINSDYSVSDDEFFRGCCIQILKAPYQEWENYYIPQDEWAKGEKVYPWNYGACTFAADGTFFVVLESPKGEYIGKWKDGSCTCIPFDNRNISREQFRDDFFDIGAETENDLFFYGYEKFVSVHLGQGEAVAETNDKIGAVNRALVNELSGDRYYVAALNATLEREDTADGTYTNFYQSGLKIMKQDGSVILESEDIISGSTDEVTFISEDAGYIYQTTNIASFSLRDAKCEPVYDFWSDAYYYEKITTIVDGYCSAENEHTLLVLCKGGNYEIWKLSYALQNSRTKKVLEWAVGGSNGFFEQAVAEFNRKSSEYQVVLRMQEEGESYKDFATRIQAEITTGGGPDLVDPDMIDVKNGLEQGYILDITEYFADYNGKMLNAAWESGLLDEQRYAVLFSCTLTTLVTNKENVSILSDWSVQNVIESVKNSGAECFLLGADTADLFYYMTLQTDSSNFVDWNNRKASFNSDMARNLLEFCASYADNSSKTDERYIRLLEKDAVAMVVYIMTPQIMKDMASVFNGNEEYTGFPVQGSVGVHIMSGYSISVNGACKEKEGALQFIEFLLSDAVQGEIADKVKKNEVIGFPVTSNALDRVYDYLRDEKMEHEPVKQEGGVEFIPVELGEKRVDMLKEMLETAKPLEERNNVFYHIVENEISGYPNNGKTASQVLDIVQNRVQLYLSEY